MKKTANIYSAIPKGYTAQAIAVEGDISNGLPSLNIVGMPSKSINESRLRIRSAITNSGFNFPAKRITINLAPAEIHKTGTALDLPIALTILKLSKQLLSHDTHKSLFVGELALDGSIRPIHGILNIIEKAISLNFEQVFIPKSNEKQASYLSSKIYIIPVQNLNEL